VSDREDKGGRLIGLLASLVACGSANPPGDEEAVCALLAGKLAEAGVPFRTLAFAPKRPSLVAEIPGREPGAFILSGHLDTVAPTAAWRTDPLTLVEEEGRLYGLGACDMKGGVAVLVTAFLEIARRGRPRHTLRLLLAADEENAYRGAAHLQQEGLLEGALFAVEAEPSAGRVLLGEPGEYWVRARFRGREAHGSTPHEGVNAILPCARFLSALEDRMRQAPSVPPFGPTTMNPGRIGGGRQVNIVPDACVAELDFRPGSEAERDRLAALLEEEGKRAAGAEGGFELEKISWLRPCFTPAEDPRVRAFLAAARTAAGREVPAAMATYCTDLPTLFPGQSPPFVIFGPGDIHQAHQPNEYVTRTSLLESAAILERFLLDELDPA
jgi:succinyl-diaminopimelate desuccinylase